MPDPIPPTITFLTDYGLADAFVGICHGVIATICPAARVIDLHHGIPRHDVRAGAIVLADALPYLPVGVHLAVVDPDVGAERRAVALALADGRTLVGPDNGLLMPAAEQSGGVLAAADIARSTFRLKPVSATFHGRDIFAPVAAALANGVPVAEVGDPLDPAELVRLEMPVAQMRDGVLVAHVRYVDGFGNLQLDAGHEDLAGTGLKLGRAVLIALDHEPGDGADAQAQYARTFADVARGELLLYEDAGRRLAVAVSHGDAAQRLGAGVGDALRIRPQ
ncbi:MAG TPA: SAM-dependent chlorinase/fluorinase [Solirubrobacteraceae bacterium]|nr:SAM-dependent chlorinase/fluorinase [Solirubrobacteraceae bacterium]